MASAEEQIIQQLKNSGAKNIQVTPPGNTPQVNPQVNPQVKFGRNDPFAPVTLEEIIPQTPSQPIQYNPGKRRFEPRTTKKPNAKNKQLLRYPLAVLNESTDYLQIKVLEYEEIGRSLISSPTGRQNQSKRSGKSILQDIILPMPSNVQDGNTVLYSDSNMNTITASALKNIQNFMEAGDSLTDNFTEAIARAGNAVKVGVKEAAASAGGVKGLQSLLSKYFASQAIGVFGGNVSIDQILAREEGIIFNPNMELLFNGPTLRGFGFSFKFTPRTTEEAEEVKTIIRVFKQYMAPKTTTSVLLLLPVLLIWVHQVFLNCLIEKDLENIHT